MAMSLKQLTNSLRNEEFQARTDEDLKKEAEGRYTQVYDTLRDTAEARKDTIDAAYAQQMQSLADSLRTGEAALGNAAARGNAAIDDYIYTRSMQRTSYGAGSKGSINAAMQKAAAALQQQYATANSGLESNRIQLAEQLADTLAQYDEDYLTDVQAYINEQKQLDYDRKVAADAAYNDIQMALYEYGKGGSGGGRRRSSGSGSGTASKSGGYDTNGLTATLRKQTADAQKAAIDAARASAVEKQRANAGVKTRPSTTQDGSKHSF